MTDVETIREMFRRAGVVFAEDWQTVEGATKKTIEFRGAGGPKNDGYGGSAATLRFNGDGSLHSVAAWEG